MSFTNPLHGHPDSSELRKEAGKYVQRLRETAGITQRELAKVVGFDYYTMVSQVEVGKTRVPPDRIQAWAAAVGEDPKVFAKRLLKHYDPFMWQILFGGKAE